MKTLAALILGVSLLSACAPTPSSGDILLSHAQARGGIAAIAAMQSVECELTINEGWEVTAHYRATRDGDMRINVFAGDERVFTEALHQGSAWAMQQGETTGSAITEEEAQILWRGVLGNVYGMHEWSSHGVRVNAHGPESIDDEEFWIVDVVHEDGFEDRFYLDIDTYLIARQRSDHALHPAIDPEIQRFETRYSDYREVDGVMFSFRQEKYDLDTDELVQHTTIRSLILNSITDRSDFLMPE